VLLFNRLEQADATPRFGDYRLGREQSWLRARQFKRQHER
jgi:hypothetical protein